MPAHPLDRSSALPLWAQLEQDLRRRIESDEFSSGAFPTDMELTAVYEVSRHTVRAAIRALNTGGLLRRERGRGTVIDRTEFEQTMGTLYSLFNMVEEAGAVQESRLLRRSSTALAATGLRSPQACFGERASATSPMWSVALARGTLRTPLPETATPPKEASHDA